MKKVLLVFGTRPEAIKMAPLVKAFLSHSDRFETKVCVTGQHRSMLDQVLSFFEIEPDYDLNLMRPGQNLFQLTADMLLGLQGVLEEFAPDVMFVHGDTTTSTVSGLAGFYSGVKVAHVEAGLRTYNKLSPFPEEVNRQITSRIADIHFAPTLMAKENLLREGIDENAIFITGNTVIDGLLWAKLKLKSYDDDEILQLKKIVNPDKKLILVTGHRRENLGEGLENICQAIRSIAEINKDVQVIYPVHLNPKVQKPVYEILQHLPNVHLLAPLSYPAFVWLMSQSYIILTDSGGIQEEAPSLGKPVLVMRDTTERPEAVMAGTVKLVGADKDKITTETLNLLDDVNHYETMSCANNPYGDGKACERIISVMTALIK